MKTIRTILYTMAAMLLIVGGFLIGERVSNFTVPAGKALVRLSVIDSLKNIPPVIVYRTDTLETIVYKDRILPAPEPTPDSTVFKYTDHIVNAYSRLIIRDWIRGELVNREIDFTPYLITKTVTEPYPVYIATEAAKAREIKLYGLTGVVFNETPKIELGLSTQKYYITSRFVPEEIINWDLKTFDVTLGRKFNVY